MYPSKQTVTWYGIQERMNDMAKIDFWRGGVEFDYGNEDYAKVRSTMERLRKEPMFKTSPWKKHSLGTWFESRKFACLLGS